MTEFAAIIAEKWNISSSLAADICSHFTKGDTVYYLIDYNPAISAELDASSLNAVYDFLQDSAGLAPKKKRVLNALKKAGALNDIIENRIKLSINGSELDDILLPYRPNPRSRAQVALKKGLGPLADCIAAQEEERKSVEELAQEYVGKAPSLKTVEDVIEGVKDILTERFAYDETVRSMVREFGRQDAFLEVLPRNKKDREFIAYRGKMPSVAEIAPEEYFRLLAAEKKKQIRIKHGIQLFRITELLRHHFIQNPDSTAFELVCEIIDECWARFLQHIVDTDVKGKLREKAEQWAIGRIVEELDKRLGKQEAEATALAFGIAGANDVVMVAFGAAGHLLGATREKRRPGDTDSASARLRQFYSRYRPAHIMLLQNENSDTARAIFAKSVGDAAKGEQIVEQEPDALTEKLAQSQWMDRECTYLDTDMRMLYALGLSLVQPLATIAQVGIEYFSIHPLQEFVSIESLSQILKRTMTEAALRKGISFVDIGGSELENLACVPAQIIDKARKQGAKDRFASKNDLLHVDGMTEVIFRNISGYIYFPNGVSALDRSLVHPDHFTWVEEMASALGISVESLIKNPEQIRSLDFDDFNEKVFIERKLIPQLSFGLQHLTTLAARSRRRMQLTDLTEGAVVSGRVTNIAQFGVFVDINAVCDGLVHISQLADGYVETADQVVSLGDQISVRILKIDKKKRRISLSMKGLGDRGPKVRPSKYQLSSLADHFKNR
jgi:uncharacterized protein